MHFYAYARVALYDALLCLGIGRGDNVLLPSLICRSVLAPLNVAGVGVRYFEVDEQLQPRLETAEPLVDARTRALLAVHYFGFPHDPEAVGDFCRRHGLAYLEDNAHGFLSAHGDRLLGTFGDIAILSFRKTMAVPHGAALLLNRPNLEPPARVQRPGSQSRELLSFALRLGSREIERLTNLDLVSWVRREPQNHEADGDEETSIARYEVSYSWLAHQIMRRLDEPGERDLRRRSFAFWLAESRGWSSLGAVPIFGELATGVVPYCMPVRTDDAPRFIGALARRGISCFTWPDLPRAAPLEAVRGAIALVPLHRHPAKLPAP